MKDSSANADSNEEHVSPDEAENAIRMYTRIVEQRLNPSLDTASALRDKALGEIEEMQQMTQALDMITLSQKANEENDRPVDVDEAGEPAPALETRVNIGEEFYVRAHIHNLERVIVDVGLGVMVEMTHDEAQSFVDRRLVALEEEAEKHSSRISQIQAHLESITKCLDELRVMAGPTKLFDAYPVAAGQ